MLDLAAEPSSASPRVASIGSNYLVVYVSSQRSGEQPGIRATLVQESGRDVLLSQRTLAPPGSATVKYPDIASDGAGYSVVWRVGVDNSNQLHAALVQADGSVDASGSHVLSAHGVVRPRLAYAKGHYLAVWQGGASSAEEPRDVFGMLWDARTLAPLSEPFTLAQVVSRYAQPEISADRDGFLVAWSEQNLLRARRVNFGSDAAPSLLPILDISPNSTTQSLSATAAGEFLVSYAKVDGRLGHERAFLRRLVYDAEPGSF